MDDRQIINEFVLESCEHLSDIENQLLAIEAGGENADIELVNTVFRAVHSIKGAAGFFQFTGIQELSHELETILNLIRNRELTPDAAITDVLLRSADKLRSMIEDIDHCQEMDISHHLTELRAILAGRVPGENAAPTEPSPEGPSAVEQAEQTIDLLQTFVSEASSETPPNPVVTAPTMPTTPTYTPDDISCNAVPVESVKHAEYPEHAVQNAPAAQSPEASVKTPAAPTGSVTETNIRVSVRVLDHLMNLAGELVLSRNQLLQTVAAKAHDNLDSISARLNQVTSEIQEAVMQTRLQVVETVFSKFPRVVRDLCASLGKQCELIVEGEDVELDKSIIEAIGDPLTHLIRNAVDHGLESPAARVKAGKSPRGRIILKAFHQAGKVNLAVSDDGAGINLSRVREKAVARGILTPDQARDIPDREALQLIFHPGFSTAEQLTNVSGRGVGMDVVRTNIERLGGTVDVDTQVGVGTTVNITLPLTLAIIPSLIVRCDGKRFAIPQASISELVRVKAAEVEDKLQRVKNAEVLRLRGNLLPLVRLSATLDLNASEKTDSPTGPRNANIIVVESGHLRYGLVVDALHDSQEIVVKPLGKHMKNCRCFAGATILGDGHVALILDVAGIAAQTSLSVREEKILAEDAAAAAAAAADSTQSMLLFTNHGEEQFAVPMGVISRLERIRGDQVDSIGGQEVLQYRGTSLALLSLEKYIKAAPRDPASRLYVVVFRVGRREVGLVAPQLTDIRRVSTDIDSTTFREPGVIGSVVIDGRATRLLDLIELTRVARPDWFPPPVPVQSNVQESQATVGNAPAAESRREGHTPTILLAEDSGFFRKQLVNFLQADGYKVLACEDGEVAWNALTQAGHPEYDLIVTDLDMPHMNGFELAKKVRGTPDMGDLPIIAVTSLASEEDIERGKRAGIDEYLIKLDRDRLMASVAEHLRAKAAAQAGAGQNT